MKFAIHNDKRVTATKELQQAIRAGSATVECSNPNCCSPLIAKCGEINVSHWAHQAGQGCADTFYESETLWHREWKDHFPEDFQEVIIHGTGKWEGVIHRADVAIPGGPVIEFQHSSLNADQIREREDFYTDNWGSMVWVVDGSEFMDRWVPLNVRGNDNSDLNDSDMKKQAANILRGMYGTHGRTKGLRRWTADGKYLGRFTPDHYSENPIQPYEGSAGFESFGELRIPEGFNCDSPELLHPVFWPHARKQWAYALCPVYFDSGMKDGTEEAPFITITEGVIPTRKFLRSKLLRREVHYAGLKFEIPEGDCPEEFIRQRPYINSRGIPKRIKLYQGDGDFSREGNQSPKGKGCAVIVEFEMGVYKTDTTTKKSHRYNNEGTREVFQWVAGISTDTSGMESSVALRQSIHHPKYLLGRYRTFNDVLAELTTIPLKQAA